MTPPYILHLPKWYPNIADPLEGIFVKRHVKCTDATFKNIVLYIRAVDFENQNKIFKSEKITDSNSLEYKVYYKKRITGIAFLDKFIKFILYYYLCIKFLQSIVREHGKPSLTVVHVMLRSAFVSYALKLLFRVPYIIIEHSTFYLQSDFSVIERFKNVMRKWAVQNSNSLVAVSENLLQKMKEIGISHQFSFQLYNTVDTSMFYGSEKPLRKIFYLLHVSEFNDEHKNITGIIQAIKQLLNNPRPIHLNLVGYGKDTELILQKIKELGCESHIHYKGKLEGSDLANEYRTADVFVLFSRKENMPCVIAEALCCGTPVISTKVGGVPEIINPTNGLLVDTGDIPTLVDAIAKYANEDWPFYPEKIADRAKQLFSKSAVADKLEGIYLKVAPDLVK